MIKHSFNLLLCILFSAITVNAQTGVSINNTGSAPRPAAILDLDDIGGTKGLLVPRMTTAERGDITPTPSGFAATLTNADAGMTIFNTSNNRYEYWDGVRWQTLLPESASGNTLDEAYDEGGNGVGRTISADNGAVDIQGTGGLLVNGNVGIGTTTPDANLNVGNANGATVYLTREDNTTAVNDVLGSLLFDSTDDTGPSTTDASTGIRAYAAESHGNSNKGGYLTFFTKPTGTGMAGAASERLRIAANGNVGVGTTAPASIFHITTTQTGNVLKLHNTSLANGSLVGHEFGKANSTNNMAEFRYNHVSDGSSANWINLGLWGSANTLTVAGTGNVGVGTTSAAQKLHVVGAGRFTSLAGTGDRLVVANASGDLVATSPAINTAQMVDGAGAATRVSYWSDANTLTSSSEFIYSASGNLSVYNAESTTGEVRLGSAWNRPGVYSSTELQLFSDATGIIFGDSDVERMRMTAAGNLGIGTNNPLYKLQVSGTAEASAYYVNHGGGNVLEVGDDAWIGDINSANTVGISGQQTSTHGGLRLGSTGYIYSNGTANIGVGTTAPIQTLDVAGRIHVTNGVLQRGGAAITGTSDLGLYSRVSGNWIRIVSNAAPIRFFSDDNTGTNVNVSIEIDGTLQARNGFRSEKNYYYFQRYKYCNCYGAGSGSWDVGYYDFCAVAQVGFKNNQSTTDEDDDVQCAVYPDGHAGYGEQSNYNVSFTYDYANRPHWQMYAEAYEDSNGVTCAASCINLD